MSNRIKQLALELLSLEDRYSAAEFKAVERALLKVDKDSEMLRIITIIKSLGNPSTHLDAQPPKRQTENTSTRSRFLSTLRKASESRVQSVAYKLKLDPNQDKKELIREIDKKISSLNEADMSDLFAPRPHSSDADQGFLGLANFILNNRDEEKKP